MIESILWLAVGLMVASSVIPRTSRVRKLIGGIGWGVFSIHWSYQPLHYLKIMDYANVLLTIVVALFCLLVAYIMFLEYRKGPLKIINNREVLHSKFSDQSEADSLDITSMLTSASALGALVYFPFANFASLNTLIIGGVTSQVTWVLQYLDIPAYMKAWNMISLNGYTVEIILACTAIESIALFMGLICAVRAPLSRLAMAFIVSVPVIYILNLIRDIFVVVAYGEQWFGADSFIIAHNYIAKAGSGIALFVISYAVLRILPELFGMIDGLWVILSNELKSLLLRSEGD
ncbi:MAG TPA: archaeosortase A [Methanosarcina vacuolata]|jgi:archaeosortase A (PGF-CTERM-specific)|uniref:Archaeosortase A n=1 Tax=Methanosarcina vacuolata Z-761 TaxID=1434123 RepID=A0A0E3Q931_9EURY|nr:MULTISPECIES: archaeosortase A [Methanosarcina]MDY0128818.1 archaeosortase A [Methanosarcina vacuolata]AKB45663.1 archaeosortase A [Methanosarcina vacuolata Z-761]AKB49131.1 archaeosortase A [Methanosarcina sp. Kolksee]HNW37682.1 archaeosortase A [Methanosarcina vacuolata]HPS88354.1 archaeosortase A [Methanosarcina vacuolata]